MSDVRPEIRKSDWISLGTYHFSKDAAAVELTDECSIQADKTFPTENYVVADAVKWVRKRQ